jgi:hypothetical protein
MKTQFIIKAMMAIMAFFLLMPAGFTEETLPYITIQGIVKDGRTQQPIAYASVYVPDAQIGTVTNSDGLFLLKVDESHKSLSFSISHLGYETGHFRIQDHLRPGRHQFLLTVKTVSLSEVVVRPDNPRQLVEKAINKIDQNYPNEPNRLIGFYREAIKQRRDYVSIIEAVVDVDQASYSRSNIADRVRVVQGRKSGEVKKMDTLLVKLQGGPHISMLLDVVKNPHVILSKEWIDAYEYTYLDVVMIENKTNYVIGFKPKLSYPFPLYHGKLYISADRLGITMAEFSLDLTDTQKATQNFVIRKPLRLRFTPYRTYYLVKYKEVNGKYQLSYVRNELEFFADYRRRIFRTNYFIMSELAITDQKSEAEGRMTFRESFRRNNILADMVPEYFDKDFWGHYNIIEPDESIEAAIERFNRRLRPDDNAGIQR